MKLNLEYNDEKKDILNKKDTEIIKKYIDKYEEQQYEEILEKEGDYDKILALSEIRNNIINWYPFKKDSTILQIGANLGEITGELCGHAKKVIAIEKSLYKAQAMSKRLKSYDNLEVVVGDFKKIPIQEKFDYIVFFDIEGENKNLEQFLKYAEGKLNKNGIILFSIDNILSIKNINCIEDITKNDKKINGMTKSKIIDIIEKFPQFKYKFYYPLPNAKLPNIIFTDKHLPSQESILRDINLYGPNAIVAFDERDIYRKIIEEDKNLFSIFTNSYLVEISKEEICEEIEYVSFGNTRKPKYRLKTIMTENVVYKEEISERSKEHLKQIKENIDILTASNINTLDSYEMGKIKSKLIRNEKSFDKKLIEIYVNEGIDSMLTQIKLFKNELFTCMEKSEENSETVFEKYNINITDDIKKQLHFVKYGIFDLIFQNCFVINNQFYFYDQEWIEYNVPIEFILYRAIFYLGNSKKEINTQYLYEKLEIYNYIEFFEKLENILQEKIKDKLIWGIHANNFKTVKKEYDTSINNRNIMAQQIKELEEKKKQNEQMLKQTISDQEKIIEQNNNILQEKEKIINEKEKIIKDLQETIQTVENSKSWRWTAPFREISKKLKG